MHLNANKTGKAFSAFFGLIHLIWVLVVASGSAQALVNWKMRMHFLSMPVTVGSFSFGTAVGLVVLAIIGGYVFGYIFAGIWNWAQK